MKKATKIILSNPSLGRKLAKELFEMKDTGKATIELGGKKYLIRQLGIK